MRSDDHPAVAPGGVERAEHLPRRGDFRPLVGGCPQQDDRREEGWEDRGAGDTVQDRAPFAVDRCKGARHRRERRQQYPRVSDDPGQGEKYEDRKQSLQRPDQRGVGIKYVGDGEQPEHADEKAEEAVH